MIQALTLAAEHSENSKLLVGSIAVVIMLVAGFWLLGKIFK